MTVAARPRCRTAWLLAAAVTMIGLFAMHGLSDGHELLASGATPSATTQLSSGSHAGHHDGRSDAEPAAVAHPGAGGVARAGAGCCGMAGHDDCLARLHYVGTDLPQHTMVTATPVPPAAGPVVVNADGGNRAPPDPTTLCVCRT